MIDFTLDKRLANDCHLLIEDDWFYLLLMDNAFVPWFIFVPKTNKTEWFQLSSEQQLNTMQQINQVSEFLCKELKTDKINVATIGNMVKQMHIHIIGRYIDDPYWPGVVWGDANKRSYNETELEQLRQQFLSFINN